MLTFCILGWFPIFLNLFALGPHGANCLFEQVAVDMVKVAHQPKDIILVSPSDFDDIILHKTGELFLSNTEDLTFSNGIELKHLDVSQMKEYSVCEDMVFIMISHANANSSVEPALTTLLRSFKNDLKLPKVVIFQDSDAKEIFEETDHLMQATHGSRMSLSVVKCDSPTAVCELVEFDGLDVTSRCKSSDIRACQDAISGSTMRVAHEEWYPIFYTVDEKGNLAGFYHDVLMMIAHKHNITLEFLGNDHPNVWGKQVNGTWRGLLGMLANGRADIAPAGLTPSVERQAHFDFSFIVSHMEMALFTRRSGDRVSMQNYTDVFDRYIWANIFFTSICLIVGMQYMHTASVGREHALSYSTTFVLKALVNKSSPLKLPRLSFKILVLTVFSFTIILHIGYKSCLNAFLAVAIPTERIRNMEDVLHKSNGVSMWSGTWLEATFDKAEDDILQKLYVKYLDDPKAQLSNYRDGLKGVVEKDYVVLGEKEAVTVLPSYSCDVIKVKDFVFDKNNLALVFQKGSKYTRVFNKEILKLKAEGVIDYLSNWYITARMRKDVDCHESSVRSLGFTNVFTPFAVLALGGLAGGVILGLERVRQCFDPTHSKPVGKLQENEEAINDDVLQKAQLLLLDQHKSKNQKIKMLNDLISKARWQF